MAAMKRRNLSLRGTVKSKAKVKAGKPNRMSAGIPSIGRFTIEGNDAFMVKASQFGGKLLRLLLAELKRHDPKAAREAAEKLSRGLDIWQQRMKAGARNVKLTNRDVRRK